VFDPVDRYLDAIDRLDREEMEYYGELPDDDMEEYLILCDDEIDEMIARGEALTEGSLIA